MPAFFPKTLYKARARIEQAVGKLKRFKRIALRCEKTSQNYGSFVALALGFILIKSVHTALVFWCIFAITAVPRIAADGLGGMAESSHKRATHPLSVDKSGFYGNDFHWVTAVLHHNPCGFQSKLFDGLGRRLSCLGSKGPAKLTRA
jgi:hypothetical protein